MQVMLYSLQSTYGVPVFRRVLACIPLVSIQERIQCAIAEKRGEERRGEERGGEHFGDALAGVSELDLAERGRCNGSRETLVWHPLLIWRLACLLLMPTVRCVAELVATLALVPTSTARSCVESTTNSIRNAMLVATNIVANFDTRTDRRAY